MCPYPMSLDFLDPYPRKAKPAMGHLRLDTPYLAAGDSAYFFGSAGRRPRDLPRRVLGPGNGRCPFGRRFACPSTPLQCATWGHTGTKSPTFHSPPFSIWATKEATPPPKPDGSAHYSLACAVALCARVSWSHRGARCSRACTNSFLARL